MILSLVALKYISRPEVVLCETASDAAYTSIGTAILMVSRTRTVWPQLKFKVRHGVTWERGLSHHNRCSPVDTSFQINHPAPGPDRFLQILLLAHQTHMLMLRFFGRCVIT